MAYILNIETAIDTASVCVAKDGHELAIAINRERNEQAGWLHTAIKRMLQETDVALPQIGAIAVSNGPGSYTGLRIGLSTAKGLCYALQKPLIVLSTLKIMAMAVKDEATGLICPMIDARRMDVFTAVYNRDLHLVTAPAALTITDHSFSDLLTKHPILFTGNGMQKLNKILHNANATFLPSNITAADMVKMSWEKYKNHDIANLAYTEPDYIKAVYTS